VDANGCSQPSAALIYEGAFASVLTLGATGAAAAVAKVSPAPKWKPLDAPIAAWVPEPPTAFRAGGKVHLVYDLHLTNFSSQDCALTRVEVLRGGGGHQPLAHDERAISRETLPGPALSNRPAWAS